MKIKQLPKDNKIYLTLALLWLLLLLMMPRSGKFNYNYRKGSPWTYETLISQFDFPILKTPEQLQAEKDAAKSSVIPYYKWSDKQVQTSMKGAESLNLDTYAYLKPRIINSLNDIYSRGIMSDESEAEEDVANKVIIIQKDKRATKAPASDVYTITSARNKLLSDAQKYSPAASMDSVLAASGVYDLLVPNLIYDKSATDLVHAETADYISPTQGFVSSGQLIVSKGELVTAEIQQMLDSYKAEYEQTLGYKGPRILLWLGNALIALGIVLLFFLAILFCSFSEFKKYNRFLYLVFIFALPALGALLLVKTNQDLLYLVPFTLPALYLLAFFKKKLVLPVYLISLMPLLIFATNGVELFTMYAVAGAVAMYFFQYFRKGWRQFVTAGITFLVMLAILLAFRLLGDVRGFSDFINVTIFVFMGCLLSVAGYPLIFLFEKGFKLVSDATLQDLCDTNSSKLLIELSRNAPGTFQHSIQVMNMAAAAADAIGANVLLVKAGALYHDIGKIKNPQCFIENETPGFDYHAKLSCKDSARAIIKHVQDGEALANSYKLPEEVKNFITTHHGTSRTTFFYNKYVNEGGDRADDADFRYNGKKPWTKEQSILMLCDGLEAASRTLKDNKPETYDNLVDKMLESKLKEGQFSESELSIKDLDTIKSVLKTYLVQMYHDRIVYPDIKN